MKRLFWTMTLSTLAIVISLPVQAQTDCQGRAEAQILGEVVSLESAVENGHDKVCLATIKVNRLWNSVLCPINEEEISGTFTTEVLGEKTCDSVEKAISKSFGGYLIQSLGAPRIYLEIEK